MMASRYDVVLWDGMGQTPVNHLAVGTGSSIALWALEDQTREPIHLIVNFGLHASLAGWCSVPTTDWRFEGDQRNGTLREGVKLQVVL